MVVVDEFFQNEWYPIQYCKNKMLVKIIIFNFHKFDF
jgi:hypothetical protein